MNNTYGYYAEQLAIIYLKNNHFKILHYNFRYKRIQIDIVAQKQDVVHVIEVKYRSNKNFLHITKTQKNNYKQYIQIYWFNRDVCFDVIYINNNLKIHHYENVLL